MGHFDDKVHRPQRYIHQYSEDQRLLGAPPRRTVYKNPLIDSIIVFLKWGVVFGSMILWSWLHYHPVWRNW